MIQSYLITEDEALALIAERLGVDPLEAVNRYFERAVLGELEVFETVFGGDYGIDHRPIPRARWAAAVFRPDPGPDYSDSWRAQCREDPIYFLPPAAYEAGFDRQMRRGDVDKIWPEPVASAPQLAKPRAKPGPKAKAMPRLLVEMRANPPEKLDAMKVSELVERFRASHAYVLKARKTVQSERTVVTVTDN
jgi:hypothetical protein